MSEVTQVTKVTEPPAPNAISYLLKTAVRAADEERPRAQQKQAGLLGMSDIGFCKALALLTMRKVPESDTAKLWPAIVGTSLGDTVEAAVAKMFPAWHIQPEVTATLTRGMYSPMAIPGHPDIVIPEWNMVIDNKSKDGVAIARRKPWSLNYEYQTWLQVLGAIQAGLLDPDRPAYQGLAFWDRSAEADLAGENELDPSLMHPVVVYKQWLPTVEDELLFWLDEVVSANLHDPTNLDPLRDVPAPLCERICAQFTNCRGALPTSEAEPITDPELVEALALYDEGRRMAKAGEALKSSARAVLSGVNGASEDFQVRWTHSEGSFVQGYETNPSDRIDVRPVRKRR